MDDYITKRMDEARQRIIHARHIADVAAAAATSEAPAQEISTDITLRYVSEILTEARHAQQPLISSHSSKADDIFVAWQLNW